MKKARTIILLFLFTIILVPKIEAQDFTCQTGNTFRTCDFNTEVTFRLRITNHTTKNLAVFIKRVLNDMPDSTWSSSLCFINCTGQDSINNAESPIPPGDTSEATIHIFSSNIPGTGKVSVQVGTIANPDYRETYTFISSTETSGIAEANTKPNCFKVYQNYPNPFNPSTVISYSLSSPAKVSIKVYDIMGTQVSTLVNQEKPSGTHQVEFDGSKLPSGIYYYRLAAGSFMQTKKMMMLK